MRIACGGNPKRMNFFTHDMVGFEIPDDWLSQSGVKGVSLNLEHFAFDGGGHLLEIPVIASPTRNPGVSWFDEKRMLRILKGIALGQPLPAIHVDRPPAPRLLFRVRNGFHRYYGSIAVGCSKTPAVELPYFDISAA